MGLFFNGPPGLQNNPPAGNATRWQKLWASPEGRFAYGALVDPEMEGVGILGRIARQGAADAVNGAIMTPTDPDQDSYGADRLPDTEKGLGVGGVKGAAQPYFKKIGKAVKGMV